MTERIKRRSKRHSSGDSARNVWDYEIVMTPSALKILGHEGEVRAKVKEESVRIPAGNGPLEEVVVWRRGKRERVVALINRHVDKIFVEQFGAPGSDPQRENAIRVVCLGIGARPDLPTGKEYVKRVRGIWKGLLPRERRAS